MQAGDTYVSKGKRLQTYEVLAVDAQIVAVRITGHSGYTSLTTFSLTHFRSITHE